MTKREYAAAGEASGEVTGSISVEVESLEATEKVCSGLLALIEDSGDKMYEECSSLVFGLGCDLDSARACSPSCSESLSDDVEDDSPSWRKSKTLGGGLFCCTIANSFPAGVFVFGAVFFCLGLSMRAATAGADCDSAIAGR